MHLSERPAGSERGASVIGVWTLSLDERVEGVGLPVERQERLSRPRPQWGHGGKAARGQMLDQRVLAADLLLGPKQTAHRDHPIPSLETEDDVARPRMDDSAVAHLVEAIVFGELVEWKLGGLTPLFGHANPAPCAPGALALRVRDSILSPRELASSDGPRARGGRYRFSPLDSPRSARDGLPVNEAERSVTLSASGRPTAHRGVPARKVIDAEWSRGLPAAREAQRR